MAAVVQHAYGFLRTLGLRNVHPVGHSRGAYLVARLTLEQVVNGVKFGVN
jgi:2-hydroxy-6-oxonona-2,4-dienedioate hydrolase